MRAYWPNFALSVLHSVGIFSNRLHCERFEIAWPLGNSKQPAMRVVLTLRARAADYTGSLIFLTSVLSQLTTIIRRSWRPKRLRSHDPMSFSSPNRAFEIALQVTQCHINQEYIEAMKKNYYEFHSNRENFHSA